jgi:predicted RNase H-like nuclease (RuvC/YqgF family)
MIPMGVMAADVEKLQGEIDRLTKENKDNHDRAEEIIEAREKEIKRLHIESGVISRENEQLKAELVLVNTRCSDAVKVCEGYTTAFKKVKAERGRLREALEYVRGYNFGHEKILLMRKIDEALNK